jgi:hypothetical protein
VLKPLSETAEAARRRRTRNPALLVTACAWIATIMLAVMHRPRLGGMDGMGGMGRISPPMAGLMVVAMMTPLVIPAVRHAAARSLRRRRRRVVALLVATHAGVWLAVGIALQAAALWLLVMVGPVAAPVTGVAVALVWHMTPMAQRCTNRHHAHPPLAAFGATADRELLSFGSQHAAQCLGACWALMLLPTLFGPYQWVAMIPSALWVWAEAVETPSPPSWRFRLPLRTGRLVRRRWGFVAARVGRPRVESMTPRHAGLL